MRGERRRTVRADNPEVLKPVVVGDAVDVIEDQRHPRAVPLLALTAHLAAAVLDALGVEAPLEVGALVARVLYENLLERTYAVRMRRRSLPRAGRIEVLRRYPPRLGVALDRPEVATGGPQPEPPQRFRPRERCCNCLA